MLMNNLKLPPIHIHPILYFFLLVAIGTGMLLEFFIIFFIVSIHELGHYISARVFRWRIRRIFLWVFGGVMETDEYGTRPIREEFLVTIAGPFQHIVIYMVIYLLEISALLPESTLLLAYQYNTFILLGNLLPIWPLDGGKLIQLCLESFFSFQTSHKWTIIISVVTVVSLSIYVYSQALFSLSFVLLMIFLIWENRLEWKRRYFKWWRFLWTRYSKSVNYRKQIEIEVPASISLLELFRLFKRDTYHRIKVYDQYGRTYWLSERDCLRSYFDQKKIHSSVGHLLTG